MQLRVQSRTRRFLGVILFAAFFGTLIIGFVSETQSAKAATAVQTQPAAFLPLGTGVDDFSFERLEVDYYLTQDAEGHSILTTEEHFVALFPDFDQNRGIRRLLPTQFNGWPTNIQVLSVTDEQGKSRPMEVEFEDDVVQITSRANSYLQGEQHFIIRYTQENVTRNFADTGVDEFYWDVNGGDWRQPFALVEVRLHLEPQLALKLSPGAMSCYYGYYGASDQCNIQKESDVFGGVIIRASQENLNATQNVTIAVGFESGTFTERNSGVFNTAGGILLTIVSAIGALFAVIAGFFARLRLGNAKGRGTIIPEYEAPQGISPLFAGVFLGKLAQSVTAEAISLAVNQKIQILERPGKSKDYGVVVKNMDFEHPEEPRFLASFMRRATLRLGDTSWLKSRTINSGAEPMMQIFSQQKKAIKSRGFRSDTHKGAQLGMGIIGIGLSVSIFVLAVANIGNQIARLLSFTALGFAVVMFFLSIALMGRTPLSRDGILLKEYLQGLKLYISVAEADRLRMLQSVSGAERGDFRHTVKAVEDSGRFIGANGLPHGAQHGTTAVNARHEHMGFFTAEGKVDQVSVVLLYEQLLPYAVIFGLEKSWTQVLGNYYTELGVTPYWYSGTSSFSAASMSSMVSSFSSTTSSSFSSSSSSGGSSGGGSSGGGGGGGGGGGV